MTAYRSGLTSSLFKVGIQARSAGITSRVKSSIELSASAVRHVAEGEWPDDVMGAGLGDLSRAEHGADQ